MSICLSIYDKNNAIRTIYTKAKINNSQQNSKSRLCEERDQTVKHIASECHKQAQKDYKTKHDWVGKVIDWESCKRLKFDNTTKGYMHNPQSVLENETHKIHRDFDWFGLV